MSEKSSTCNAHLVLEMCFAKNIVGKEGRWYDDFLCTASSFHSVTHSGTVHTSKLSWNSKTVVPGGRLEARPPSLRVPWCPLLDELV